MAIDKNVNVTLSAKDQASPVVKKMNKLLGEGTVSSLKSVGAAFVAVNQVVELTSKVLSKVTGAIGATIDAANKQEDAINRVNSSLMQMGEFTPQVSAELQIYASELQKTTKIGDEAALAQLAYVQAMGATVEQSKLAVTASADMAEALGVDLATATRQAAQTLGGMAGRLGMMIPELKNLTKEELMAGKGIELLAKKFDGFAKRGVKTFSGAMIQSQNAFGDLLEQFGFLITKNPAVIATINAATEAFKSLADYISKIDMAAVIENAKDFAVALGIASLAVGGYIAYASAATIATTAWAAATSVLAGAMAIITSPITLVIAGVAALATGIYFLIKNLDTVIGALKVGFAFALQAALMPLTMFLKGLSLVVGIFNKEWASSIDGAVDKIGGLVQGLKDSGKAQMKAKAGAEANAEANKAVAAAAELAKQKILAQEQALVKLNVQYAKAVGAADSAFAAAQEFAPSLKLDEFLKEQKDFEKALADMKKKGDDLKIRLSAEGDSAEIQGQIDLITQKQQQAEVAIAALKIKTQRGIREARLQEVSIELEQQKQKVFTTEQEIKQMRISSAQENRDLLIEIEKQRLLEQRGLVTEEAKAGISIREASMIEANQIELNAFKAGLEAKKELALTIEQQKQMELANLRASLLSGTDQGESAGSSAEVIAEQQKIAQLTSLREQELISEAQFQSDKAAIVHAGKQKQTSMEMALEEQRIQALGLSPEALQGKLDLQREKDAMELENLRYKLETKQLTEEEFRVASSQVEEQSLANANSIRQNQLQKEVSQNKMKGQSFQATLKEIELAQQRHGKVMGTIKAMQSSAEFGAMQGMLGNLSSLRNSSSRKEFEIGKASAIAQASVATFMGATQAYAALSGIPIVGPALGIAAAAAAVAAGTMNIKQIKSQKFGGGGVTSSSGSISTTDTPSETIGGQAHNGMDAVPQSMNNKSFIVAGGERIVQKEANKDLTGFLKDGSGKGNTYNVNVYADASSNVEAIKKSVMDGIREASERGETVISSRGVA